MSTLVTGAAGFIGSHVCEALAARGEEVLGLDEMNDYYPVSLKTHRLSRLRDLPGFRFVRHELGAWAMGAGVLRGVDRIIHLAAWAGVRNSTAHPVLYGEANIMATLRLFEAARLAGIRSVVYASSSSSKRLASVYGATKRACEDLADAYGSLHGMTMTGLRYHTVYGPRGRPDMAMWKFARAIHAGEAIEVYNNGDMSRDFSFVSDIVDATILAHDRKAAPGDVRVFDVGSGRRRKLLDMIHLIEQAMGKTVERVMLPMQPGDVESTLADNGPARAAFGYQPSVDLEAGIPRFVAWYLEHRAAGGVA